MRKLIGLLLAVVILSGVCYAEELSIGSIVKAIPDLKQGVMYDIRNKEVEYISTAQILKYKDLSIEIGYSPKTEILGIVSYKLGSLEKVDIPLLNWVSFNIGMGVGYDRLDKDVSKTDDSGLIYGVTATLIDIKF